MVQIGYAISSEEVQPNTAVRNAQRAEQAGFRFALVSDHFHPWISEQGHSPFVWSVLGGIATMTTTLRVGTGVTCPTMRIHPAIIAHAAATTAAMMPRRFFLGVGTGENLNEHVLGQRWPAYAVRAEMLEESLDVIRLLWQGGEQSHYGKYYTVENARLYTLPEELPLIMIAASGEQSAGLAGRMGDGFISTAPKAKLVKAFEAEGAAGRPKYGQLTVSYAEDDATARQIAYRYWPNAALGGELSQELPTPTHFEQAVKNVREEDVAESVVCSSDPRKHIEAIQEYIDAGFDHVYVHQVGPEQEPFINFYQKSVLPEFAMEKV
jgi:coenzyme F420-dependent glucose-6-phosphate dehydrogenase